MPYAEKFLEQGERIIYVAEKRWAAYAMALALFIGLMMVRQFFGLYGTELAVTNKRVIGKTGAIWRHEIAWPHKNIESVQVRQSATGRLFDYGVLVLRAKDGSKMRFKGIAYPYEAQQVIEESIELAVLGRKLSQSVLPKW